MLLFILPLVSTVNRIIPVKLGEKIRTHNAFEMQRTFFFSVALQVNG